MNKRELKSSHDFGKLLDRLILISNQKNYALANALGYDVSYISKWINGSMLPASKNCNHVCRSIANFIVKSSEGIALSDLNAIYNTDNNDELIDRITDALLLSYHESTGKSDRSDNYFIETENNAKTVINPRLQRHYLNVVEGDFKFVDKIEIVMLVDIFSLGKEDKLSIANIEQNSILDTNSNPIKMQVHYLIAVDHRSMDIVFDTILFINMLTNYVGIDFKVFLCNKVPCSILFAIRNFYMHMSIITENHRAIVSNTSLDKSIANEMYDTLISMEESLAVAMLDEMDMKSFVENKLYMHSIIAPNIRWLIGKVDELFLPMDIFEEILQKLNFEDEKYIDSLRKLHLMSLSALDISDIRVAIYDSAFCEYVLSGELDFFGHHVIVDLEQRLRHINYMHDLFTDNQNLQLHIINGNFVSDFKNHSNPCVYLSNNLQYLRLNSEVKHDSYLRVVRNTELKEVFNSFYDEIWNNHDELTIADNRSIDEKFDNYTNMLKLLKNV